jgi:hypothetical protein
MTREEIVKVQEAVSQGSTAVLTDFTADQEILYNFLVRQIEYFLAPSIVARVSEIQSSIPSTNGLCKVDNPSEVNAPENTFWILSGISATPIGDKYEVTREYTSIPAAWSDVQTLYNDW